MRARAQIEERESSGKSQIVVTEIPYQVNKENLVKSIAELASAKKIEGISGVNDESDKDGMRIVIELKRDAIPNVVLNQLYKHTDMQSTFGVIMLALDKGAPKVMNLKELLERYIEHRHEIVVRRTQFDLTAAEAREHILDGLKIAVDNIDEVIKIIRGSEDTPQADARLRKRFGLSEKQSEAILNMRLAKLTGSRNRQARGGAQGSARDHQGSQEHSRLTPKRMAILKSEMAEVVEQFGDERRTEIVADQDEFTVEDLIAEEDMVITISHSGYIKRIPVTTYKRQRRGGRGLNGADLKVDDWVEHLFIASTHDYLLFFTNAGHLYWLKVHEIPQGGRAARGKPVVNCIAIKPNEQVAALVPVREFTDDKSLIFATRQGTVKKTVLSAYGNVRTTGICAINVDDGDELIDVQVCDQNSDIVLATKDGMSIRFHQGDVRDMGRATTGVKGIELEKDDEVIGMVVVRRDATLLVVSEKGFGKRSELTDYRVQKRGGKGIITLKKTEKTGFIVALKEVIPDDELMMITRHGVIIRLPGGRHPGHRAEHARRQGDESRHRRRGSGCRPGGEGRRVRHRGGCGGRRSGAFGGRRVTAATEPAVGIEAVRSAARLLAGVAVRTPLVEVPVHSRLVGVPVLPQVRAAPADRRVQDSWRLHGGVARGRGWECAAGSMTQSSGNHGQAVAYAGRAFGLRAVVVMPKSTPRIKVEGVRRHGGEVVFAGATRSGEQLLRAQAIAADEGLVMIPPYDHPDVMAGQGTVGLEILEQRPEVHTILSPVSGGGLIAGISVAVAALRPSVRLIGVEPAGAAKLGAALAAGRPTTLERTAASPTGCSPGRSVS